LTPRLAAKKELKIESETKLAAARSTHELLNKELLAASGHHRDEQENVRRAAAAVMTAEAEALVEDIWRAKQTAWALSDRLDALGYVRVNPRQTVSRPPGALEAIQVIHPPALAGNVKQPRAVQIEIWNGYLEKLTQDPGASHD
jgi:hypothetical protein